MSLEQSIESSVRKLFWILSIFLGCWVYSQQSQLYVKQSIAQLDSLMQYQDESILALLDQELSFGHSNGWIQNKSDFIKDFNSNKVTYTSIKNIEFLSFKKLSRKMLVQRKIEVKGRYKEYPFAMMLLTTEIWNKKSRNVWLLWFRQSVEYKP